MLVIEIFCNFCKRSDSSASLNPRGLWRLMRRGGWLRGQGRHVCPACAAKGVTP